MLDEIIEHLSLKKGGNYIDCTLGGAGYTIAIAKAIGSKGRVLAIDLDGAAIENAEKKIKKEGLKNIILVNENFRNLSQVIQDKFEKNIKFDGIVFDLGLSSYQLEDGDRGFSFLSNDSLDMSFQGDNHRTFRIVNRWKEDNIEKIIREYGEERYAKKIAKAIVLYRKKEKIKNSVQLAEIIQKVVPYKKKHPHASTKTFQALRIATNDELQNIEQTLPQALENLSPGGKLAVVSFHSLEDRVVKNFFKHESKDCICPPEFPTCQCDHKKTLKIITKKPLIPTKKEVANNRRSRSAKLRVAEKL